MECWIWIVNNQTKFQFPKLFSFARQFTILCFEWTHFSGSLYASHIENDIIELQIEIHFQKSDYVILFSSYFEQNQPGIF